MFVVDSNILIHAANADAPEHPACNAALTQWQAQTGRWYLTWSICFEFLRVVTHRRALAAPLSLTGAWAFIETLQKSRALRFLVAGEAYPEAFADTIKAAPFISGNDVHDAHIAAIMKEHGVRTIYTCDMGFHRFPFLEVIDPVARA